MLQGVDEIASMPRQLFRAGLKDLVGRTYDLESAYRQLAIHPVDCDKALIGVYDEGLHRPRVFEMASMAFGAVASVYAFLRTAAATTSVAVSSKSP